ncbi:MAG: Ig domain-containing protein [Pseudomonadota bacterium]
MSRLITPLRWMLLLALLAPGCDCGGSEELCVPGQTTCIDLPEYVLVCAVDGQGWESRLCPGTEVCFRGNCHDLACSPGSLRCEGHAVATCKDDGSGFDPAVDCEAGLVCDRGSCVATVCDTGDRRCAGNGSVEQCAPPGLEWVFERRCGDDESCADGACLPGSCSDGDTECGPATRYLCSGGSWQAEPCVAGRACLFGTCVECVADDNCADGGQCRDGSCQEGAPSVVTTALPPATVGQAYMTNLQAQGGAPPYSWSVTVGSLPAGLTLSPSGTLLGTPTAAGSFAFSVEVADSQAHTGSAALGVEVYAEGPLSVVTTSLPAAEHGLDYSATLQASGGVTPYGWQLLSGPLPQGLGLWSHGEITGVPAEIGDFPLTLRVFDASTPAAYATVDLTLTVEIAPLAITGDNTINLLLTRVVILPTLVQLIPYLTNLQVLGGLPPYAWSEQDPPTGLGWLISSWGLPDGLTLSAEGRLSGWVTDVSDALTISIPFGPTLTGYFIYVRVEDSQNPADSDEAIFLLPTVPIP